MGPAREWGKPCDTSLSQVAFGTDAHAGQWPFRRALIPAQRPSLAGSPSVAGPLGASAGTDEMTLCLALAGNDGLLLAADTVGGWRGPDTIQNISLTHTKVYAIGDGAWVLIAGQDAGVLRTAVEDYARERSAAMNSIAARCEDLRGFLIEQYRRAFRDHPANTQVLRDGFELPAVHSYPEWEVMVCACDGAGAHIYRLLSRNMFRRERRCHDGEAVGLSDLSGYLRERFHRAEMSRHQLERVSFLIAAETKRLHLHVGGRWDMVWLTPDGGASMRSVPFHELEADADRLNAAMLGALRGALGAGPPPSTPAGG